MPPVEMISQPRSTRPWAKATIPRLSLTRSGPEAWAPGHVRLRRIRAARAARRAPRRARPPAGADAPASSTRAASVSGRVARQHRHAAWARMAPRSYSSSTRCTVQPLSPAPLGSTASCTRWPYMPLPAERRQQGGVHVDDPAAIARDDLGRHQLEVPRQHQQVDALRLERGQPLGAAPPVAQARRAAMPRSRARSRAGASAGRSAPGPCAPWRSHRKPHRAGPRGCCPRPETATATRIGMAEEGNRRGPRFA